MEHFYGVKNVELVAKKEYCCYIHLQGNLSRGSEQLLPKPNKYHYGKRFSLAHKLSSDESTSDLTSYSIQGGAKVGLQFFI